jgi:hypothetical protein
MDDTPADWREQAVNRAIRAEVLALYTLTDEEMGVSE